MGNLSNNLDFVSSSLTEQEEGLFKKNNYIIDDIDPLVVPITAALHNAMFREGDLFSNAVIRNKLLDSKSPLGSIKLSAPDNRKRIFELKRPMFDMPGGILQLSNSITWDLGRGNGLIFPTVKHDTESPSSLSWYDFCNKAFGTRPSNMEFPDLLKVTVPWILSQMEPEFLNAIGINSELQTVDNVRGVRTRVSIMFGMAGHSILLENITPIGA